MSDSRIPPPVEPVVDGQGIGIHLSYLRRDMDEVKVTQQKLHADVIAKLNEMQGAYPTRKEFEELEKNVDDHEERLRVGEKFIWKAVGVSSAVSVLATFLMQILIK